MFPSDLLQLLIHWEFFEAIRIHMIGPDCPTIFCFIGIPYGEKADVSLMKSYPIVLFVFPIPVIPDTIHSGFVQIPYKIQGDCLVSEGQLRT